MKDKLRLSNLQSHTLYATMSSGLDLGIVVLMVAIGRILGEEEFGKLSFVQSLAMIFISWGNFGLNQIVIRDVAHDRSQAPLYLRSVVPWTILLSLAALLLFVGYLYLSGEQNRQLIWIGTIIGFATVFRYLTMTFRAFSQALGRFDKEFRNVLLENILLIPLGLALLLLGFGLLETAMGIALGRLFGVLVQSYSLSQEIEQTRWILSPDWGKALSLQKTAISVGFGIAVAMLSLNIDTILLTYLTNFAQVGLYNASLKIFVGLLIVPGVANAVLLPRIARAAVRGNAIKEFWLGSTYLLLAAVGLIVTLGPFSTEIIITLFGVRYAPAGEVLFWHLVACIPAFQVMMVRIYLIAIGKSHLFLVFTIIGLIIRTIFLWVVVPRFGLVAGVQAVLAAEIITYIIALTFLRSSPGSPAVAAHNP